MELEINSVTFGGIKVEVVHDTGDIRLTQIAGSAPDDAVVMTYRTLQQIWWYVDRPTKDRDR